MNTTSKNPLKVLEDMVMVHGESGNTWVRGPIRYTRVSIIIVGYHIYPIPHLSTFASGREPATESQMFLVLVRVSGMPLTSPALIAAKYSCQTLPVSADVLRTGSALESEGGKSRNLGIRDALAECTNFVV